VRIGLVRIKGGKGLEKKKKNKKRGRFRRDKKQALMTTNRHHESKRVSRNSASRVRRSFIVGLVRRGRKQWARKLEVPKKELERAGKNEV